MSETSTVRRTGPRPTAVRVLRHARDRTERRRHVVADHREVLVNRMAELLSTVAAGTVGAVLAVTIVGASLLFVVPAVVGVATVALVAPRRGDR